MASAFSARQLPARLAIRQPRVCSVNISKRTLQSTAISQGQNTAYPLYPSVIQLLHEKGIPESEISKIPASGPKGRLLKGDVLAYLGAIASDYPSIQASRLQKLAHLDLSNIKLAPPPPPAQPAAPVVEKEVPAPPLTASVAVSVSLGAVLSVQQKIKETLGTTVPLSTFLVRATDLANDALPRSSTEKPTVDELFDEILGAEPINFSRGDYFPELNKLDPSEVTPAKKKPVAEDIIDILAGKTVKKTARKLPAAQSPSNGSALNVFSLTVPVGEEKRARTFLERVKDLLQVDPGRLVL
ncbi:pyridoxine biosynthesis protein [Monascus purpureus]|uniref:Pyridoxine biosynthesis protein n=1 Tax=Monascus purpureus TaxID=5098 RepID=A0A507R1G5_MONPU|nr:pyridoxine biosynthesis protein [Monascus purpureus]BDD63556.1 hypothetical protein MAP00_008431 [Monascus purpureus]